MSLLMATYYLHAIALTRDLPSAVAADATAEAALARRTGRVPGERP